MSDSFVEMRIGDKRLEVVFDNITNRIGEKQTLSMRKLAACRNEEVQFGRFVGNHKVTVELLEQQLYANTQKNCHTAHCLLIEDTSQIGFSLHRSIKDMGKADKGQIQGFYIHPVLAIDARNFDCYGIAALQFVSRPWPQQELTHKQSSCIRDKIPFEQKEGYRWFSSIKKALPHCLNAARKTVVADREADIYPLLAGLSDELGVDYVIRCRFDRPLQNGATLFSDVDSWSEDSCYQIKVPATDKRSAHSANMIIKYGKVSLKKSRGKSTNIHAEHHSAYVVEVKEMLESVVNGEQPIHWVLLTTHYVGESQMALQITRWYKQRWTIEQVFRTLKSKGLKIESSQLAEYGKLQKMTILALIAAVKVMQLIKARDGETAQSISVAFTEQEQRCLILLNNQLEGKTEKLKNPYLQDSLAFAAWVIARLAGWSGYKSQRPAGPIDFLTGLQRFNERFLGYMLPKDS